MRPGDCNLWQKCTCFPSWEVKDLAAAVKRIDYCEAELAIATDFIDDYRINHKDSNWYHDPVFVYGGVAFSFVAGATIAAMMIRRR